MVMDIVGGCLSPFFNRWYIVLQLIIANQLQSKQMEKFDQREDKLGVMGLVGKLA